ncbi:MAG: hypothetical protein AAGH88_15385 [Planctomycetota bacterium]
MAQPPVDKIRMGNLSAAIWQNRDAQEQPFYVCTFSRSYTDTEGNWHESSSFGRGDLLRLSRLADQAHSRIESLIQEGRADATQNGTSKQRTTAAAKARSRQR